MERPLTGEPIAVDLVNTRWQTPDGERDLLATRTGLEQWLTERGLDAAPDPDTHQALLTTRRTLQRAFAGEAAAESEINAILARGIIVRRLVDGETQDQALFADPAWAPAWLAVDDYLRMHSACATGIRRCGNPACVLYFYDPTGRRRWCSMAGCGNRVKARRHYQRRQETARSARS